MKNKLIVTYFLTVLCGLFILFITYEYFFVPQYVLNGGKIETTIIDEKYIDKGITIKYRAKEITEIITLSNVNINKPGNYNVKYKIVLNNKEILVAKRIVSVVDPIAPVITLEGNKEYIVDYKSIYKDPGYKTIDNYDKDITDKTKIKNNINTSKLGNYKVFYESTDSSGNKTIAKRTIIVKDISAPEIKLNRNKNYYAIIGTPINTNDFEAVDNYDGDVKKKVSVDGTVDFNKAGKYKITYTVSDSSSNTQVLESTINVQEKNTSGIPVLMYHYFYDDEKGEKGGTSFARNFMPKTSFESQIKYLVDNNYYFPTWQELENYIDGKIELPKKSVIITDDDGNESFFRLALPIVQKYDIPITSFVIGQNNDWTSYSGRDSLEFQMHSYNMHNRNCNKTWNGDAMCATYEELYEDVKKSSERVDSKYAYAYPFGHYNDILISALKANNIKMAFTTDPGKVKKSDNKYLLPRVRISKGITITEYEKSL